ncbi:hypothetical protein OFEAOIEE_LOCUS3188 [Methylorubrum extorquens]
MSNPMLPLSPISNDGFLQHKPTLVSDGLNSSSRPLPDLGPFRIACPFRKLNRT